MGCNSRKNNNKTVVCTFSYLYQRAETSSRDPIEGLQGFQVDHTFYKLDVKRKSRLLITKFGVCVTPVHPLHYLR